MPVFSQGSQRESYAWIAQCGAGHVLGPVPRGFNHPLNNPAQAVADLAAATPAPGEPGGRLVDAKGRVLGAAPRGEVVRAVSTAGVAAGVAAPGGTAGMSAGGRAAAERRAQRAMERAAQAAAEAAAAGGGYGGGSQHLPWSGFPTSSHHSGTQGGQSTTTGPISHAGPPGGVGYGGGYGGPGGLGGLSGIPGQAQGYVPPMPPGPGPWVLSQRAVTVDGLEEDCAECIARGLAGPGAYGAGSGLRSGGGNGRGGYGGGHMLGGYGPGGPAKHGGRKRRRVFFGLFGLRGGAGESDAAGPGDNIYAPPSPGGLRRARNKHAKRGGFDMFGGGPEPAHRGGRGVLGSLFGLFGGGRGPKRGGGRGRGHGSAHGMREVFGGGNGSGYGYDKNGDGRPVADWLRNDDHGDDRQFLRIVRRRVGHKTQLYHVRRPKAPKNRRGGLEDHDSERVDGVGGAGNGLTMAERGAREGLMKLDKRTMLELSKMRTYARPMDEEQAQRLLRKGYKFLDE